MSSIVGGVPRTTVPMSPSRLDDLVGVRRDRQRHPHRADAFRPLAARWHHLDIAECRPSVRDGVVDQRLRPLLKGIPWLQTVIVVIDATVRFGDVATGVDYKVPRSPRPSWSPPPEPPDGAGHRVPAGRRRCRPPPGSRWTSSGCRTGTPPTSRCRSTCSTMTPSRWISPCRSTPPPMSAMPIVIRVGDGAAGARFLRWPVRHPAPRHRHPAGTGQAGHRRTACERSCRRRDRADRQPVDAVTSTPQQFARGVKLDESWRRRSTPRAAADHHRTALPAG